MTPIDLDRLRALYEAAQDDEACSDGALCDWNNEIHVAAPALFDELEAARAEIVRLGSALLLSDAYVERAAIVAWLQEHPFRISAHAAAEIERGDHLAAKEHP